jgi:hypothetical protein
MLDKSIDTIKKMKSHFNEESCIKKEPFIKLGEGQAPILNYNIPQTACFNTYGHQYSEPPPKMNLVRSYKLGGFARDMDDLGGSFGRFSLRIYVKGMVQDQDFNDLQFRKFHLNISEIGFRYIDEFSFNDNQDLGYRKHDINNPETPARFSITSSSGSIELKNSDYRRLRNRGLGLGRDFMLLTAPRYMSSKEGLKVKPNIIFFFKK